MRRLYADLASSEIRRPSDKADLAHHPRAGGEVGLGEWLVDFPMPATDHRPPIKNRRTIHTESAAAAPSPPELIAERYWRLHTQARDQWEHEILLRG
jgi:hypothetical protein